MPSLVKYGEAADAIDASNADSDNRSPGSEVNGLLGSSDDGHKAGSEPGFIPNLIIPFTCEAVCTNLVSVSN